MIKADEYYAKINELRKLMKECGESLDLAGLKGELSALENQQNQSGFYNDLEKSKTVNKRIKHIQNILKEYGEITKHIDDIQAMLDLSEELNEDSFEDEITQSITKAQDITDIFWIKTLLKGKHDANNAIITIHAGAGGTEAQDWADMLFRMYRMYCENNGFSVTVLDMLDGEEAGIKSVTFKAEGINAYGYLKAEKGVHRLVRISPFDSNKRRHTSFSSVEVMPEIENDDEVEIKSEEIKIDTYRSGGAGGQNVNKVESAVRITHLPTNTVVQCQNERSQLQNKEQCFKMLRSKLIELQERSQLEQLQSMKGTIKKIEWGSQIRSYVFCPYTMVKDHRTNYETGNVDAVMDGEIDGFISEYLKKS
ncbi:MAG: peptide chain release factor 2 [Clostridia bacterium]|nr:peptide chain release factor 2 [Clostridia bacterium]